MDQPTPPNLVRTTLPGAEAPFGKRLPRAAQITLLLFAAALLFAAFLAVPAVMQLVSPRQATETAASAPTTRGTTFKVTDRQWATLKVAPVQERVFQDVTVADGKIALDDDFVTPVFSPFSGRIVRLMARAGDTVAAGAPLFAIQASELAQAENDLIAAAANLRTAKAQLVLSTTNEKRQHDLFLAQGGSLKDWQQAQLDLATAQGGLNTASTALAAVRNRLRVFGQTDAEIAAIETSTDILGMMAETVVTAPIGGIVVQRQLGSGQNIVSASLGSTTPVFLIGDLSRLWLVANVREEDAPRLHVGAAADVNVLALPNQTFHAHLSYVAPSIDPTTHRLAVRAEIDNASGLLKPEMFAAFRIITGDPVRSVAVPAVAVVHEADSAHVWIANPADKTLGLRQIEAGRIRDNMVEVTDGLKPGDQVVTAGAVFIDRAATGD